MLDKSERDRYDYRMEYVTLKEAEALLNLGAGTLRKHCLAGRIGRKLGSQWVLTPEDLERVRQMNHRPGRPPQS